MTFSDDALSLVRAMVAEMSTIKHAYRETFSGCYEYCIGHKGFTRPAESKDAVIDKAIEVLNIAMDNRRIQ